MQWDSQNLSVLHKDIDPEIEFSPEYNLNDLSEESRIALKNLMYEWDDVGWVSGK